MAFGGQRLRFGAAIVLVAVALSGCTSLSRNHGWAPTESDLAEIRVGRDTRDTVAKAIGAPGTAGLLADSGWYYVESRWEQFGPRAPKEVDRQVVAISFDRRGVVTNVERFGLADGQVVALSRRVTESNVQGSSFLRQLFGSFGQMTAEQLLRQ